MKLSIIVPVFNEAGTIISFLEPLQRLRERGHELIIVDGGSNDETPVLAKPLSDKCVTAKKGRAAQMNLGALVASGEVYMFLHADTLLPVNSDNFVEKAMVKTKRKWGRFNIKLSGKGITLRLIGWLMNLRSRLTGIATGDQCIFVEAETFKQIGGFKNIPLMEDIAFSKALKKVSRPICLKQKALTSSRRWEQYGVWRTIFLMWKLRWAYFRGVDPKKLAAKYH